MPRRQNDLAPLLPRAAAIRAAAPGRKALWSICQELSERRAGTIKRYLTEKFGIAGTDLIAVGYGKSKPKKPDAPMDAINRRVQVVNMETRNAAK
jgi:OmpA family